MFYEPSELRTLFLEINLGNWELSDHETSGEAADKSLISRHCQSSKEVNKRFLCGYMSEGMHISNFLDLNEEQTFAFVQMEGPFPFLGVQWLM